jgi:hypothetical protein
VIEMRNTIKGLMKDFGFYRIHRDEVDNIEEMNMKQLIVYSLFCFSLAGLGIAFLIW